MLALKTQNDWLNSSAGSWPSTASPYKHRQLPITVQRCSLKIFKLDLHFNTKKKKKNFRASRSRPEFEISSHRTQLKVPLSENASHVELSQLLLSITDICYLHYITVQIGKRELVVKTSQLLCIDGAFRSSLVPQQSNTRSSTRPYRTTAATHALYH